MSDLIVVICEGATVAHFEALAALGLAPAWTALTKSGYRHSLECGPAPYEPSNLATAFTGTGRGRHGCYSYWSMREGLPDKPRILTSVDVQEPWFWQWPELGGLTKGVFNVQLTDPPQSIDGVLFSYLMRQRLHYTFPSSLREDMVAQGLRYGHDVSAFYGGEGADWLWRRTEAIASYQLNTALHYGAATDLLVVNLTLIDRVSHFFWADPQGFATEGTGILQRAYEWTDAALGRLELLANGAPMLIFSEIGFGGIDGFVSLDDALADAGLQTRDSNNRIDRERSTAFEAAQGSHGILINGKGKALRDEIMDVLLSAQDTETGAPLVAQVTPPTALYNGPAVALAPDLVVEPADPRRPPLGDGRWARHVNRTLQTGWHRDKGFALWVRCLGVKEGADSIALEDIAPTLAGLLNRAAPRGLDGKCRLS